MQLVAAFILFNSPLWAIDLDQGVSFSASNESLKQVAQDILHQLDEAGSTGWDVAVSPPKISIEFKTDPDGLPQEVFQMIGDLVASRAKPPSVNMTLRRIKAERALSFLAESTGSKLTIENKTILFQREPETIIVDAFISNDPEKLIKHALWLRAGDFAPPTFDGKLEHMISGEMLYVVGLEYSWQNVHEVASGKRRGKGKER